MRGGAGIGGAEEGKDGPVARRNREYARCKVCHTVSLNVRVSRCGQSLSRRITSSVLTAFSRAALYHIAICRYDCLETHSAPKSACMWVGSEFMRWGHRICVTVAPEYRAESQRILGWHRYLTGTTSVPGRQCRERKPKAIPALRGEFIGLLCKLLGKLLWRRMWAHRPIMSDL